MFETFDHTADVGLRVTAATLEELFVEAARGLTSLLVENIDEVRPSLTETIRLVGSEADYLLFDWLNELLFRFETSKLLCCEFIVHLSDQGLDATIRGEPSDPTRHRLVHEVKAITYHGLSVQQTESGWQAELILDI